MFGLKELSLNRLAMALMGVSAMLMLLGFAAPEDGSVSTLLTWLVGALLLIGVWVLMLLETLKRYFGGPTDSS